MSFSRDERLKAEVPSPPEPRKLPSACEHIERALIALRRAGVDMHELAKTPLKVDPHTFIAVRSELGAPFGQTKVMLYCSGEFFVLIEGE